jgi:hypothetical protein
MDGTRSYRINMVVVGDTISIIWIISITIMIELPSKIKIIILISGRLRSINGKEE